MSKYESIVSIVRGKDVSKMVQEAVGLLGGVDRFFNRHDFAFIKPNVCGGISGKTGTFTSVEVVSSIISLLKGKVGRIAVGEADSSMYLADKMMRETGILDVAKDLDVDAVNLSRGEMVDMNVRDCYILDSIRVNRILSEAKIISAPVAKTHITTDVTLNLKNMYGILPEMKKGKYHSKIDPIIVDVAKALPPVLCIIDATTCLEGEGPFRGDTLNLDLIVAGDNAVAADAVMANIMGYDPKKIMHLRLAFEKGLGPISLNDIDVRGEDLNSVRRDFKKAPREPYSRVLAKIPGIGHLIVHYYYEKAVKSWKKKTRR
ncbi:DUF362 domain-containing protein [Candidatus Bathyarchaeota archaeon]|nr:DUF362 domain-containing protein [Candidatus Bathyarchaeota archaeon]